MVLVVPFLAPFTSLCEVVFGICDFATSLEEKTVGKLGDDL